MSEQRASEDLSSGPLSAANSLNDFVQIDSPALSQFLYLSET